MLNYLIISFFNFVIFIFILFTFDKNLLIIFMNFKLNLNFKKFYLKNLKFIFFISFNLIKTIIIFNVLFVNLL